MKIQFSKHSGWTPPRFFEIDTDRLAEKEKQEVERLIHRSEILSSKPLEEEESAVRDGDDYTLAVTTDSGTYCWQWYGIGSPPGPDALLELLAYCSQRAKPKVN